MAKRFLSGLFGKKTKDETPKDNPDEATDLSAPESVEDNDAALPSADKSSGESDIVQGLARHDDGVNDDVMPDHNDQAIQDEMEDDMKTPEAPIGLASKEMEDPTSENLADEQSTQPKKGFFSRLKAGLSKTSGKLSEGVTSIFTKRKLDDDMLEELENLLISADLGVGAATRLTAQLAKTRYDKEISDEEVKQALSDEVAKTLKPYEQPLMIETRHKPHVILMTGVNGAGKTTTIGKLAAKFKADGLSVMLAAGDTFRAAAIEQLTVWGERTNTPVIARQVGADAAGLAFDALKQAQADNIDILMIDTAGRLQNRTELMDELAKIVRVIGKLDESAPHDTLLVLDATVGQNALSQVEVFKEVAGVSGLVMTKLDGTARGGVLVALADKFALPIHYIGVGEAIDDLQAFEAENFAQALAGV